MTKSFKTVDKRTQNECSCYYKLRKLQKAERWADAGASGEISPELGYV